MISEHFDINGPSWLVGDGEDKEIIISTRTRIVRNLAGYFFPSRCKVAELKEISDKIESAISEIQFNTVLRVSSLTGTDADFLRERQIFISDTPSAKNGSIFISDEEDMYFSINGDNHLYMVFMGSGADLYPVFMRAMERVRDLSSKLDFAKDKRWGYLTATVTDVGTGLRIGANFHLWGVCVSGRLNQIEGILKSNSMGIRGFFSYGFEVIGYMFHIYTLKTLGVTEEDVFEQARNTITNIVRLERDARADIVERARYQLEDRVSRALGVLKYSRLIGAHEALNLLLALKMGLDSGLVAGCDLKTILNLLLLIQPAHIGQFFNPELSNPASLDITRAEIIKEKIGSAELI